MFDQLSGAVALVIQPESAPRIVIASFVEAEQHHSLIAYLLRARLFLIRQRYPEGVYHSLQQHVCRSLHIYANYRMSS